MSIKENENASAWLFTMLLIKEIAERFFRLKEYIKEAEVAVVEREPQLLDYLRVSVDYKINELSRSWRIVGENQKTFGIEDGVTYLITVGRHLKAFKDLHAYLQWFYTPWVEAETETFLRDLFETPSAQRYFNELRVAVGFSEEYDFVHPYSKKDSHARRSNTPNVIALPRIEKNNPLIWPILMHELGHAIVRTANIDHALEDKIRTISSSYQEQEIIQQWGQELSSHLLALKVLGPSYLLCYLNYYLFIFHEEATLDATSLYTFHNNTEDCPSPKKRIDFLKERLDEMDHRFLGPSGDTLLKSYLGLFDTRLNLELKKRDFHTPSSEEGTIGTDEEFKKGDFGKIASSKGRTIVVTDELYMKLKSFVIEEVRKAFPSLGLTVFSYDGEGYTLAGQLSKRLKNRELISSWRDQKIVEEADKQTAAPYDLKAACRILREDPCPVSSILNAGWLFKLGHDLEVIPLEESDEKEATTHQEKKAKIRPLNEELEVQQYISRLLQKSIETAAIHRFFKENGGEV